MEQTLKNVYNGKKIAFLMQSARMDEKRSRKLLLKESVKEFTLHIHLFSSCRLCVEDEKQASSTCTRQVNSTCEHLSKSCVPFSLVCWICITITCRVKTGEERRRAKKVFVLLLI